MSELSLVEQEIQILEAQARIRYCLPHLYGQKMYRWQRRFFESRNKYCCLTAANQVGKSAINIRKIIRWATDTDLWPKLWKKPPTQFWYLYPTGELATAEFENKWVTEFLPRDEMKNHPVYGWTKKMRNGDIEYIRFNTGITIYFKTYAQNVHSLQAGSCHAVFADEEVIWDLMSELQMRVSATNGHMNFVFTATRGQEEWRRVMEEKGKLEMWKEGEVDILKQQISTYDCLVYEDGTPSEIWSLEKIQEMTSFLHSDAQIQRRIFGRFVKDEGLKYPCFTRELLIPYEPIDYKAGQIYAALDYGSGTNHSSAICLLWVNREYTRGIIFDTWIGEKGIATTAGDVVEKYKQMLVSHGLRREQVIAYYDWSAADLKNIAASDGLFFEKADKSHATGERILNTLFKNTQLMIMDNGDGERMCKQIETLSIDESKKYADDDGADVARYSVTKVPWTYTNLRDVPITIPKGTQQLSRHGMQAKNNDELMSFEDEVMEWNDYFQGEDYDSFSL